jgi:hypothetical protein
MAGHSSGPWVPELKSTGLTGSSIEWTGSTCHLGG